MSGVADPASLLPPAVPEARPGALRAGFSGAETLLRTGRTRELNGVLILDDVRP